MAKYRPGTADPFASMARAMARDARRRAEANTPGKTQAYQTTSKVGQAELAAQEAKASAEDAREAALTAAEEAAKAVKGAAGVSPITVEVDEATRVATVSHDASGVAAGSYGPASDLAPGWGDTVTIPPRVSFDACGHATQAQGRTLTIPSATATASADGLMAKEDKAKLDGYPDAFSATAEAHTLPAGSAPSASVELEGGGFAFGFGIPKGAKGDRGEPGQDGADGAPGKDGSDGAPGQAATISGMTATVDANVGTPSVSVTMGGTAQSRSFALAFKNLKGQKGDRGEQGPKGDPGPSGAGLSSYFKSASGTKSVGTSWTTVCSASFSSVSGAQSCIAQAAAVASASKAFEARLTFDGAQAASIKSSADGTSSTYPGTGTYPGTPSQPNSASLAAFAAPSPSGGVAVALQARADSTVSVTASLTSRADFFE